MDSNFVIQRPLPFQRLQRECKIAKQLVSCAETYPTCDKCPIYIEEHGTEEQKKEVKEMYERHSIHNFKKQ